MRSSYEEIRTKHRNAMRIQFKGTARVNPGASPERFEGADTPARPGARVRPIASHEGAVQSRGGE